MSDCHASDAGLRLSRLAENDVRIFFAFNLSRDRCLYVNPAFENFFQIKANEASVPALFSRVHQDDKYFLKETFAKVKPGDFHRNVDFRMLLPDAKEYWLRLSVFFDEEDGDRIVTGYLEDISAAKAHSNKLNEYSNKKNAVLGILAHELAGPLGTIQMFSQYLSTAAQRYDDSKIHALISRIEQISRRSTAMIQEFLKVEFIESAGVEMVKQRTDLVESLSSLMKEYQESEGRLNINFEFKTGSQEIFARVDEPKFVQAINNLITNAIKFTPDGGTISLNIEKQDTRILITVKDTGIGIPQQHHATLFDKFSSARRTGLKGQPSVGLGMSIIKMIIEWHNGKIWFESSADTGTTFFIELNGQ
jgi:two-component system sensor histidine kinase VicK